jgi:ribosomal-protein-alanine N-acetyltransferase
MYTVRAMQAGDIPRVVEIDRISYSSPWSAWEYMYELSHSHRAFYYVVLRPPMAGEEDPGNGWGTWIRSLSASLGLQRSRVIGYVGFRLRGTEAHVTTIAVHPHWRSMRLGELLLLTAISRAIDLACDEVTLEVRVSNRVAQRLYLKYGFGLTGKLRGYYRDGEDALSMAVDVGNMAYHERLEELQRVLLQRIHWRHTDDGGQPASTLADKHTVAHG